MNSRFTMVIRKLALALVATSVAALVAAIAFGGPKAIAPMESIDNPFGAIDFSDLPPLSRYKAEDGADLAYRFYPSAGRGPKGSIVLVHGSSASSNSMHVLAKGFSKAGFDAYALDIRGHGASGTKGTIDYIGQLEDDLAMFVKSVPLAKPRTLAGFSSGGGFVLRFAGSQGQDEFQNYLLLSPFISQDAPNYRPNSGGWVSVGVPRAVGLTVLNQLGIRAFNGLPITNFALTEEAKSFLTPSYTFNLAVNFRPQRDYAADIRSVHQALAVVAGSSDEAFKTDELEGIFRGQGKTWPVTLLPGVGHIPLILDDRAVDAAVRAVVAMSK